MKRDKIDYKSGDDAWVGVGDDEAEQVGEELKEDQSACKIPLQLLFVEIL